LADIEKNESQITFEVESKRFSSLYKLSNREYDVVLTLIQNITNSDDMAKQLGISAHTVNNHLKSIFDKTNTKSKTEILACFLSFAAKKMSRERLFSKRPRVLIIDDEPSICEFVQEGLQERGLKTYVCTNPKDALELVNDFNIEVIISDVRMPEKDGMTLLKELRGKKLYWPYFIFMTGFADFSIEQSLHAGAAGYIEKPIQLDKLFNMITETLAEYSSDKMQFTEKKPVKSVPVKRVIDLHASEMGVGGAFLPLTAKLQKQKNLKVGTVVDLLLQPENMVKQLNVQARIIWERSEETQELAAGLGVKFLAMDDDDRDTLMEYVRNNQISSFIPEGKLQ